MNDILSAYSKAKKVINSCITPEQLSSANTYINLFFEQYSVPSKRYTVFAGLPFWYKYSIVKADNTTSAMYSELKKLLKEKQKNFVE